MNPFLVVLMSLLIGLAALIAGGFWTINSHTKRAFCLAIGLTVVGGAMFIYGIIATFPRS